MCNVISYYFYSKAFFEDNSGPTVAARPQGRPWGEGRPLAPENNNNNNNENNNNNNNAEERPHND